MRSAMRWAIAPSVTAIAMSSRSAPSRWGRTEGSETIAGSPRKVRETPRHFAIDLAPERHHEIGDAVEPFPAPAIKFGRLAVAWRQRVDIPIISRETQREPFLPLAAEFGESVRRSLIGRKLVSEPARFAEIVGQRHAGLFPEFAQRGGAQVFAFVDAALRHLPLKSGKDDLRPVVLETPSDQDLTGRVEEGDAHIRAVRFVVGHPASPEAGAYTSRDGELGGRSHYCLSMILFGKPVPTHRVVARGHAFPDHAPRCGECINCCIGKMCNVSEVRVSYLKERRIPSPRAHRPGA